MSFIDQRSFETALPADLFRTNRNDILRPNNLDEDGLTYNEAMLLARTGYKMDKVGLNAESDSEKEKELKKRNDLSYEVAQSNIDYILDSLHETTEAQRALQEAVSKLNPADIYNGNVQRVIDNSQNVYDLSGTVMDEKYALVKDITITTASGQVLRLDQYGSFVDMEGKPVAQNVLDEVDWQSKDAQALKVASEEIVGAHDQRNLAGRMMFSAADKMSMDNYKEWQAQVDAEKDAPDSVGGTKLQCEIDPNSAFSKAAGWVTSGTVDSSLLLPPQAQADYDAGTKLAAAPAPAPAPAP